MAYMALYRKWRPQSFKDLVGQDHISRTLSQAITTGRIGHAYLFAGPRGTGKTSTAKILAKALNCAEGPTPDPCGKCEQCQKIMGGTAMDVFEIDAASNRGIDEIRDLRETVKFAPAEGRYKVYIIDEVHMLTSEAFNALLKTLEEPPEHVVFILATTEAHKVPPTIQARCQRYDFHRITVEDIEARLHTIVEQMGMQAEDEALAMIAVQADGGLRDALSILDQCSVLTEDKITAERVRQILGLVGHDWIYRITAAIAQHEAQQVLEIIAELLRDGKELRQILAELSLHFRSLMIYQAAGSLAHMDLYAEQQEVLQEQSHFFTPEQVMAIIGRLHDAMNELKWSPQPRISVEVTLLALAHGQLGEAGTELAGAAAPQPDASATGNTQDEARIAKLEAQLAKVTAQLAQGIPAKPAASAAKVPLPKASKPKKALPPGSPEPDPKEVSPEGQAVWDQVVAKLKADNRQEVLSSISKAKFAEITATTLTLWFPSAFLGTLATNIYRRKLEAVIEEVTGQQLALRSISPEQAAPAKKPVRSMQAEKQEKAVVDLKKLPPEERHPLDEALKVFGGKVVSVEGEVEKPAVQQQAKPTPPAPPAEETSVPKQPAGQKSAGTTPVVSEEPTGFEAPPPPDDDDFVPSEEE